MQSPIIKKHCGIMVVRDDLFPGGSKARYLRKMLRASMVSPDQAPDEIVYASPAEGGAQYAIATVAKEFGIKASIFVAARKDPHPRRIQAEKLGAIYHDVRPGYLAVVQCRAKDYADEKPKRSLLPFGMDYPGASHILAESMIEIDYQPSEIWAAAGSGTLMRAMRLAWPNANAHAVQVGRELSYQNVMGAEIHIHALPFSKQCKSRPPFPSDPHYDAKAWEKCLRYHKSKNTLFWNVCGPA